MDRKVALVTGGNRGIGKEIALVLAEDGYDIALNYRSENEDLTAVINEIENMREDIKCFTVKADCKYMPLFMILVSLISCRLIGYAISFNNDENKFDKVIKFFSNISYEIYLVQYPIIFFMSNINIPFKNILIIFLVSL